jgi:signal transduction histidine kinase
MRHALPDGEPQLLGRSTEAIGSGDSTVSRRHAELTPSDGAWWITDLKSTHGTLVNGQRLAARTALRDGDQIRCGQTIYAFHGPGGPAGQTSSAGSLAMGSGPSNSGASIHADPERLRAIGETVATLSHSVKNILQGLRSGADAVELALGKGDLGMAREGWPIVARNLDRISWLVMNMLAFAKDRPLEISETDLGALVADVCELMQATAARKRVKLTASVDQGLPPAPIDANAVHQIILNLVANAIEAAPDRSGHVEVRARLDGARNTMFLEVQDDGAGVPPAQRPWLFAAFASTKGQRGTGLGLAVAQKLAQQHGGTIVHADAQPHGTIMRVDLPADRDDPDSEKTRGPVSSGPPAIAFER